MTWDRDADMTIFESIVLSKSCIYRTRSTLIASWYLILTWLLLSIVSSIWILRYWLTLKYVSLYDLIMIWSLIRVYKTSIASLHWHDYSSQLFHQKNCIYRTLKRVVILNARCVIEFQIRFVVRLVRDLIICQCLVVDAWVLDVCFQRSFLSSFSHNFVRKRDTKNVIVRVNITMR